VTANASRVPALRRARLRQIRCASNSLDSTAASIASTTNSSPPNRPNGGRVEARPQHNGHVYQRLVDGSPSLMIVDRLQAAAAPGRRGA
jgi:hypothetical protein